ncbi:histone-lysine N-methyltransferase EHMT2 isoform X1 [Nasonia vitripennis]|uniref:Histone-lysine N-methyltransferase EHMT2 n=1 Tax=Nasonia vitripennis TaxID=7425 RepID=A0A7M7TCI7_NASVI|nr:histone-lysine N-methyltransferase EHMT2 isoform X1 [Nasonia vitripennis]XP_008212424.1 histone-lysine N-methyltransferase EHMT2 isoform X1 [Nasonia vitripennis]XP_008212426.1 histone-lysine N-methyltransferase EHMT2 isoform X1 [Nasonia vitripennis]XP_008212428.1 histone-lysine N-methyltransferase EHMT2 isoform X1 [Nasonia vitripennis]XP_031778900.1 histone-lysine N-methyltransferase EHMT2 isoform X1 [Nasonia vitripennis]XP_032453508.1 histone-lysine N-methyltransferase EHMT2 isoform X1 [Na
MSESDCMDTSSAVGSQKEDTEDEDMSSKSKLSIQQILEGMTNEFNNTPRKIQRSVVQVRKPEKPQPKVVEDSAKVIKVNKSLNNVQEEVKIVKENVPQKKVEKSPAKSEEPQKQEATNKSRIVLTFRTIDENTGQGKKTKISSCPSNLSLVPDELINCNQIGGVSVKIENFDEICDSVNKSDKEDSQKQSPGKNVKSPTASKEKKNEQNNLEKNVLEKEKPSPETEKSNSETVVENRKNGGDSVADKPPMESETITPVTRKARQKRLRELSVEPELKRSARRLSKESSKTTVLESAMARKEKFNYTEESTKRKYSKPGRPRKVLPEKKDTIPLLNPIEPQKVVAEKDSIPKKDTALKKDTLSKKESVAQKNNLSKKDNVPKKVEVSEVDVPPEKDIASKVDTSSPMKDDVSKSDISPRKDNLPKKNHIPKLTPLDSIKPISEKKAPIPKLNPLVPQKLISDKHLPKLPKLSPLNSPRFMIGKNKNNPKLDSSQKSNKYEGMPKLTPIIKNPEIVQQTFSQPSARTIKIVQDETLLENENEAFRKPVSMKLKRIKNRIQAISNARKLAKGITGESLPSTEEDMGSSDDAMLEENSTSTKRMRRHLIPSPSTAEGQASTPESTAILSKIRTGKPTKHEMQCLCEMRSQLFVTITSTESPLYCTAMDSIDNQIVGCCNEVDHDDVAMRRPSARIPYIILCRKHKERLIRHNCCPTCGLFCSQGKFVHCSNGHQYHRDCEMYYEKKPLCPHCGSYGLSFDVIITMAGKRKPVQPPLRKEFPKEPSAKISLPGSGDNTKLAEQQPVQKKSDEPLINPELVHIPEPTNNANVEKPERYTFISLYNAAKNGELQKLVNVLANGFNANHTFKEQGHRTGLHVAADKGFLACVHVLVQAGAQVDVLDRNQLSPLMLAAANGKADVVRYLMKVGADVTLKGEDGMTALHMAAKSGHLDVCQVILSECKVPRTLVDSVDDGGWTSLIWACEFRHADVARYLLNNKCDPLIRDSEQNIALHWSAFSGSSDITELLLNLGCDVNAVNVHGDTPLHIASRQDQYAVSVLLLSRGAKVGEVNAMGETAIDCCGGTGDTLNALQLNFKVNQRAEHMLEKTIKILTNDISRGKESNPVQCVNGFDSEDKPTDFVYVTESCFTSKVNVDRTITSLQSCRCEDNCSSDKCLCGNISLRCWYDDEGKLVPEFNYADPPMLFECNPACDCNKITCNNRVVQHGLTQRFQLFRTEGKGWGIRTLRHISKGSYVCEYVGEIISDSEADQREDDSYLFDLDNRDGETYCIDARRYGNLARFINHSCAPNLLPVRVFIEHQDLHFPRIAFFANRDIDADEELGFDYGEKFWIIKCKSFTCTCGAEICKYSDKTIQTTLDNYRKKVQAEEIRVAQQAAAKV